MPVVPTVTGRQVESRGVQTGGFQTVQQPNLGDVISDVGQKYVGLFAEAKQRADVAVSQDAALQLSQFSSDLMTHPETGLLTLQGKNAIGKGQEYAQQLDARTQELASTLPESARAGFLQQAQQQRTQFATQAGRYEIGQINAYEEGQFQSVLQNSGKTAASMYGDSAAYVSANRAAFQQIDDYGTAHGWSEEQIQSKKIEFKEAAAKATAQNAIGANYKAVYQRNSELSDAVSGSSRVSGSGGSAGDGARGIRNNNPGNLEYSKENPWVGQNGDDGRFAKFETPEHGIRALGRNLLSYQRQGVDTVGEIVNRWAPEKDGNNTAAYIKAVCERLGITADQPLDASNPDTLRALCAAIIHHENGSQPYSDQQISSGVSAALGLSQLSTSTKRYTGTAWFDALNEADQANVLRQTEALDKQQREEYRSQFDAEKKNGYAALDEGLMPSQSFSQQQFINAHGPVDGPRQWADYQQQKEYGAVIGVAKDLSPTARADILERARPQDPDDPSFAANQQRWEKMQGKFKQMDTEWEEQQGRSRLVSSMQNNFPLDPNDKSNQSAVDRYFSQDIAPSFSISDPQSINSLAAVTTKSGIIPTQVKTMLNSGATSRDPALVVPMAKFYGQLFDNNPAVAATLDRGTMAFYGKVYDYSRSGVPEDKAVEMAYDQVFKQDDRTKKMLDTAMRDKDYISARSKASQSNANSLAPFEYWSPDITDPSESNLLYQRDYQTIYDLNFSKTGGDADQAEKITNAMIRTTWGISTVNGKAEMMKYAPEALYGVSNGAGNWIQGQWEQEKRELKSKSFGGARSDTDLILVADAITPRDKRYAIMVLQPDANGVIKPRNYIGENGLPIRFEPEQQTSPMYKQTMQYQQQRVNESRVKRENNTPSQFSNKAGYTPPDLTKPFGYGSANNLPSNIYAGEK